MKKAISIFLAIITVLFVLALPPALAANTVSVGDLLTFGSYPQSQAAETQTLKAAADAAQNAGHGGFFYEYSHSPTGEPAPNLQVQVTDFFSEGEKYRRIRFAQYRPDIPTHESDIYYSHQDENGYFADTDYYFRYEPLQWRVLDPSTGLVLCEKIIDSQPYQSFFYTVVTSYPQTSITSYQGKNSTVLANDYETSTIRAFLNRDFFETAFTDSQKANIRTTALNNDAFDVRYEQFNSAETNDRLFLLSYTDALNSAYGFDTTANSAVPDPAKTAVCTDYAKCRGLWPMDDGTADWWLRSAGLRPDHASRVASDGATIGGGSTVGSTSMGVRPACTLESLVSDGSLSDTLFSEQCKYLVKLSNERGGNVFPAAGIVASDKAPVTVRATPTAPYRFDGWYDGEIKVSGEESYTFTAAKDITLTAKYIAPSLVTIYVDGPIGCGSVSGHTALPYGATAAFTAEPNSGYRFAGWFRNGVNISNDMTYSFIITENVTLTAKFEKATADEPEQPPTSTEPAPSDPGSNNSGSANFFQRLIQMILNFFRNLFGK